MKAAEWERIKALFDAAIAVPERERALWLDHVCASQPELRETIEGLLISWDETAQSDVRERAPDPIFEIGKRVANRFRIIRFIARGGMGEVYEASDESLRGLRVALKTIRTELAGEQSAYERFKREVWVAREISHEGLCRVFDLVEHIETGIDGTPKVIPCLNMQLLEGNTLGSILASKRPFTIENALPLIRQMSGALEVMHRNGIVHRDIKPTNMMLVSGEPGRCDRVVVMDFGLAKPLNKSSLRWDTQSVDRAGAPYFLAPEVLRGEKGGVGVDIYALGLVIDEMVTSSEAFPHGSIEELFWKKLHAEPIEPSRRSAGLPARWNDAILHAIHRDPDKRPPSVSDLLRQLEDEPVPYPVARVPQPAAPETGEYPPPPVPSPNGRARFGWSRRAWIGGAVGASAFTGVAAVVGGSPAVVETSLLIYPIANLTRQVEYDSLCTGTSDELMRRLSYAKGLRVYPVREPRRSGATESKSAAYSLDGNLQHHRGRVRLSLQLIDNATGELAWSEQFEGTLGDPLALESEIAEALVDALRGRVLKEAGIGDSVHRAARRFGRPVRRWLGLELSPLAIQPTSNNAAFSEYIKGRHLWQKRTLRDTQGAIGHFRRAIDQDPKFALAYSALADVQHTLLTFGEGDPRAAAEDANRFAQEAVALNPTLPEVHVSLAGARQLMWDWRGAELAFREALNVRPGSARAHHWFAGLLLQFTRFDEALAEAREGLAIDPFDYPSQSAYGNYLWQAGRVQDAAVHLESMLAKTDLLYGHIVLGQVYAEMAGSSPEPQSTNYFVKSMRESSLVRTREFDAAGGSDATGFLKWSDLMFVQVHAARRDRASARVYISRLEHGLISGRLPASFVARAHAVMGDYARAIELLERGYALRERDMFNIRAMPCFRQLHRNSQFESIVRRMGLLAL